MHIERLYSCFLRSAGICTDTRQLRSGQLFWALKGPNFNGNLFAAAALEAGAAFAVTDEDTGITDPRILRVDDGLRGLQELALHHRQVWGKEIFAVCGSNGKTTTKELITRVLTTRFRVFATPGNLNNHIGVPLCLLQLREEHEMAVLELGANHSGEIAELCRLARPDAGLITNIGKDHLEGFGTIENTALANGELFDFLKSHSGTVILNEDEDWNLYLRSRAGRIFSFPGSGSDSPCQQADSGFFVRFIIPGLGEWESKLTGRYNFHNLAAALAVGRYYGVDPAQAADALCSYEPANNRSQLLETGRNRVICDAYNANPSSMLAALENLVSLDHPKRIAILGDMLELGKDSEREHREMGLWCNRHPEITCWVTGKEMAAFASACPAARYFREKSELENWLSASRPDEALVLLKGSRGLKLESLIGFL